MALAIDASSPAGVTRTGTGTTMVTASFTAPSGALLLALIAYNSDTALSNNQTVTDSGGLTWTRSARKSKDAGSLGGAGQEGGAEVWWAVTASAAARTVTSTQTLNAVYGGGILRVLVITGQHLTTPIGDIQAASSSSGLPSRALTLAGSNSWCFAASSDWAQAGLGTAGTAQTILTEGNVAGQFSAHTWRQNATSGAAGGTVTMNLTAPAAENYNILAVEVREPAGAVAASIPDIVMSQRAW